MSLPVIRGRYCRGMIGVSNTKIPSQFDKGDYVIVRQDIGKRGKFSVAAPV